MLQEDEKKNEKLRNERATGKAYLGVENTGDKVKSEAEWFQEALGKVLNMTARKTRICTYSMRWWNGEI